MKTIIISLALSLIALTAQAAPNSRSLSAAQSSDQGLLLATSVSKVQDVTIARGKSLGMDVVVRTLDAEEGNMNATRLLLTISKDDEVKNFIIDTGLSVVGSVTGKMDMSRTAAGGLGALSGVYLTVSGVKTNFGQNGSGHAVQAAFTVRLTDSFFALLNDLEIEEIAAAGPGLACPQDKMVYIDKAEGGNGWTCSK